MAIIQISKIQQRSGKLVDLPQLDNAQFGWANDAKRLFIGAPDPENVEVLTSYSNISFSQITGTQGSNVNITDVLPGQVLSYDVITNNWINAGGNALDPGNTSYYTTTDIHLGSVENVKLGGGAIGYVLETDGTGNLSWTPKGTIISFIDDVTQSNPGVVTTVQDNFFTDSMQITITDVDGMTQLNGNTYYVNVLTSNTFSLYSDSGLTSPVDTTGFTAYTGNGRAISTISGGSGIGAGGSNGTVQFNNGGLLDGSANLVLNGANLTVAANLIAGNVFANSGRVIGTLLTGAITTNAQPNITSLGILTSLSVSGNANVGNVNTAGLVTATGNITGGNISTSGALTVTGNTNAGNLRTTGLVTATGNITGGNLITGGILTVAGNANIGNVGTGLVTATGNITGANLVTSGVLSVTGNANIGNIGTGIVTATGNVTGANFITSGIISVAGNANVGNLRTTGLITATGNLTAGNIQTSGQVSASGNATVLGIKTDNYYYANGVVVNFGGTYSNSNVAAYLPTYTGTVGATSSTHRGSTLTTGANTTPGTIIGSWNLSTGSSLTATYADLAEYYEADHEYEPGTVLEFGGNKEVTLAQDETTRVAGVVSTNPAYAMNSKCPGNAVAIALQGRVPVKVRGKVQKGDMMVSAGNGYARPTNSPKLGTIIGKSLVDFDGVEGVIEIAVGRL